MKHFPSITKEIQDAAHELREIIAYDFVAKKSPTRLSQRLQKSKTKRKTSLANTRQITTRLPLHTNTAISGTTTTRR